MSDHIPSRLRVQLSSLTEQRRLARRQCDHPADDSQAAEQTRRQKRSQTPAAANPATNQRVPSTDAAARTATNLIKSRTGDSLSG